MKFDQKAKEFFLTQPSAVILFLSIFIVLSSLFLEVAQNKELMQIALNKVPQDELETTETLAQKETQGSITISSNVKGVDKSMQESLLSYYETFYSSLSALKPQDITEHFYQNEINAKSAGTFDQTFIDTLIDLRSHQPTDLRIQDYLVNLDITKLEWLNDKTIQITLKENQDLVFAQTPDIHSVSNNIENIFRLEYQDGSWQISRHTRDEDLFLLLSQYLKDIDPDISQQDAALSQLKKNILSRALPVLVEKEEQREALKETDVNNNTETPGYNREEAVSYAHDYALARNQDYESFDETGGNCNNFISQCLIAGGLSPDTLGDYNWYYEGYWGPAASWLLVDSFYDYISNNKEGGFKASVSDNLYSGQKGDILQYGENNNWKHSVIITDVVTDSEGNVIDYLIDSNTTDRQNFPASAYGYPQFRLIKILGAQ